MKRIRLTKEEKEIESSLLQGKYVKVSDKELDDIRQSLVDRKKDLTMTIRVNSEDINRIRQKAIKAGVRYQTFISEIIHQVAMR